MQMENYKIQIKYNANGKLYNSNKSYGIQIENYTIVLN